MSEYQWKSSPIARGLIVMAGVLLSLGILTLVSSRRAPSAPPAATSDSAFAGVQERGKAVMGVDQYTSQHQFVPLPDGGRIVLARDPSDSVGVATIRAHMADIAQRFSRGDFALPSMVHAMDVPGTEAMAAGRDRISYAADAVPGGGAVRITTSDPELVKAVHEFLGFQAGDHRAR